MGWTSYHSAGKTKKTVTFHAECSNPGWYCHDFVGTKKSLMMLQRIARLLVTTEEEQSLALDDAWCEENEQLLF